MRCRAVAFAVFLLVLTPLAGHAADGDYDPSFGGGAVSPFDGTSAGGGGLVLLPDGHVVAGDVAGGSLKIARYDTTGTLDAGFGAGGVRTLLAPGPYLNEIIRLPDGTFVVRAGTVIAHYDADWNPDPAFGVAGIAALPDCGSELYPLAALVVRDDGTLVVGMPNGDNGSCVTRFSSEGFPDATFGVNGTVTLSGFVVSALKAQGEKLVVGGAKTISPFALAAVRLLSDGSVDGGFGTGGMFVQSLPDSTLITAFAQRSDGSLLALANTGAIVSLSPNGKLDPSFGTDGVAESGVILGIEDAPNIRSIAIQRDGRILVGGGFTDYSTFLPFSYSFLVRHDFDGTLDSSFGTNGYHASISGLVAALALQPDGKVLVAGATDFSAPPFPPDPGRFYVARHLGFTLPCAPSAVSGCHASVAPLTGKLRMDDSAASPKANFQWKWAKGAATTLGDFGDPIGGDDFTLCLYDESAGSTLTTGAVIPGGGLCNGKPCWKALGTTGIAYGDSKRSRFGISAIKLKAGAAGKAQVSIKGQGGGIPAPSLPAALPLRIQLFAENGQCWESVFSTTGTTRNDGVRYQGKSD